MLVSMPVLASDNPQHQLETLEIKIAALKKNLSQTKNKKNLLHQALADTDKAIGQEVLTLRSLKKTLHEKEARISTLEKKKRQCSEQLQRQQTLLAEHLNIHYRMGEYQPLKWFLTQDKHYTTSQLITLHQYLIHSREATIQKIQSIQASLLSNQQQLRLELSKQKQLQQQLLTRQKTLKTNKAYQTHLIQTYHRDIKDKQQALEELNHNKKALTRLIHSLAEKNHKHRQIRFSGLRHKLPRPLAIQSNASKAINQGLLFFAKEGTPVAAVSSGRILFSDWLRGYGLLLIIDHGQGFMTLYGHNQSLLKKKGDTVSQGEPIATVGHSGGLIQNGLYFEVRRRGKAVSPSEWLS